MKPKEKAKELTHKFQTEYIEYSIGINRMSISTAKQCALICVDEIYKLNDLEVGRYDGEKNVDMYYSYWEEVKTEIERL